MQVSLRFDDGLVASAHASAPSAAMIIAGGCVAAGESER